MGLKKTVHMAVEVCDTRDFDGTLHYPCLNPRAIPNRIAFLGSKGDDGN
jgi:hypothetical protein